MRNGNNEKQFALAALFSIVAVALNYALTFFLTSFITNNIGAEAYGYVTLARTVANYASFFSIAINSFAARYISVEYHKGNYDNANAYFNTVFIADLIVCALITVISIPFITYLERFIVVSETYVSDVKNLFFLNVINFSIVSLTTVFLTGSVIKNRLELTNLSKCIAYVVEGLLLFVMFCSLSPHIYYVGFGLCLSSAIILVLNSLITHRFTPELRIKLNCFSQKAFREVLGAGIWNAVNNIGNTLNTGLDLLITNVMLTALQMGQLGIIKTVTTIFSSMFQLLAQPFQPLQLDYYANGDLKGLVRSFKMGIKINGLLSNIAFAGFFVFGPVYYSLWTPGQDISLIQSVTVIAIIGSIIEGAVYPLYFIYTITIKNKVPCAVTICSGLLNVIGMYILIRYFNMGLYAVVGTTTVLSWLVNFVFNPIYSAYCLHISKFAFYPTLARHIISCFLITATFKAFSFVFYPNSWITLIICGIICAVLGCLIHLIVVFEGNERQQLFTRFWHIIK